MNPPATETPSFSVKQQTKWLWNAEEDRLLYEVVAVHGPKNWNFIADFVPGRSAKQCRERWHNHVDPSLKKGKWTHEEDLAVAKLTRQYGFKWAHIAKAIPGRADNDVKNRYNRYLKKALESGEITISPEISPSYSHVPPPSFPPLMSYEHNKHPPMPLFAEDPFMWNHNKRQLNFLDMEDAKRRCVLPGPAQIFGLREPGVKMPGFWSPSSHTNHNEQNGISDNNKRTSSTPGFRCSSPITNSVTTTTSPNANHRTSSPTPTPPTPTNGNSNTETTDLTTVTAPSSPTPESSNTIFNSPNINHTRKSTLPSWFELAASVGLE
jgi:hypothetical protein